MTFDVQISDVDKDLVPTWDSDGPHTRAVVRVSPGVLGARDLTRLTVQLTATH